MLDMQKETENERTRYLKFLGYSFSKHIYTNFI